MRLTQLVHIQILQLHKFYYHQITLCILLYSKCNIDMKLCPLDSAPLLSNGDANDHHLEPRSQPLSEPPTSNTGNNTAQQQPTATGLQQPIQMQTMTGPGQTLMPPQAYPQPTYYVGGFYPPQVYGLDPRMMASPPPVAYITPSQSHTYFYPGHQQVYFILSSFTSLCAVCSIN